jgi:uncharacterized integral membrane protein
MTKLITTKRLEGETEKAREYVKVHILLPSGLLGLVFMVSGTAALLYQFFAETYSWRTFLQSTGLLVAGGLLGWTQTHENLFARRAEASEKGGSTPFA